MPLYLPGLILPTTGGYGGSTYSYSSYGNGVFPRLPFPPSGGYGGAPYGHASYSSWDVVPPRVSGANSVGGFQVEVFFSEEMRGDVALTDPARYSLSAVWGAPVGVISVARGTPGVMGGCTSVILTHTGSTLGGKYSVLATGLRDVTGNPITNSPAYFASYGDSTQAVATALPGGKRVRLQFRTSEGDPQPVLTEEEFSPGVEDLESYTVSTLYPVAPELQDLRQNPENLSEVEFGLHPMTSAQYELRVGPALAFGYTGEVLPDSDPDFEGVEQGTGTSVATTSGGLLLSKNAGASYGWVFEDLSGRVLPGTSFRADFQVDVTGTTVQPATYNAPLVAFAVSDGAVQVTLILEDVGGIKVVSILSGAYASQVPALWNAGPVTFSLLRNQRGGFYSVLLDGVPLQTFSLASATGVATYNPGCVVLLSSLPTVNLFALKGVQLSASATIYTSAWNFIHDYDLSFIGSPDLATRVLKTKRGPLVRNWGDATPAGKQDVTLRVQGVEVEVAGVNPYLGEVYPLVPVPQSSPGTVTVALDYAWQMNPAMPLAGLNTRGLSLNTWDRSVGHTPGSISPVPATSVGAAARRRFPLGIALAPLRRASPKQIGHRYIGFQKDYSALLSSPTTLLLNQDPHRISVGGISASTVREIGIFNGETTPPNTATPWNLTGQDSGGVQGDGTYQLVDATAGSYGVGFAAVYSRNLDLSLPTSVLESARFRVEDFVADGVFTGVSVGMHDGRQLLMVGALVIAGVRHVGLLLDASKTHLEEGWQLGLSASGTASSQTSLTVPTASLPAGISSGSRFRVVSGSQTGVYTIAECGLSASGDSVSISLEEALPSDITAFGGDTFTLYFETPWDTDLISVRIQAEYPGGKASVYLGGVVSGTVASGVTLTATPAQTALLLPATEKGVVFWGAVSRQATSSSLWDLAQYSSNPERMTQAVQGITVFSEMQVVPEEDPNDPWYVVGGFGYSEVSGGDHVLLKSTSASEDASVDLSFYYERTEPYLNTRTKTDLEAVFRVESGVMGAGDAQIILGDSVREVQLCTLLYTQSATARALVTDLPVVSLSGLRLPTSEGWEISPGSSLPAPVVRDQDLEFTKTASEEGTYLSEILPPTSVSYRGLIVEARLSVQTSSVGDQGIGFLLGARVQTSGSTSRQVSLTLGVGEVQLRDSSTALVASFPVVWDDQLQHTYRLLLDPDADLVVLVVDDAVVGSEPLSSFSSALAAPRVEVGCAGSGLCTFTLDSVSAVALRPEALVGSVLGRTLGLRLRDTDSQDIDSYRTPRSDSSPRALNSSLTAIPVEMDWRDYLQVRLLLDPTWGVSLYRPDLPLPPGYTGTYTTEITDPTAAWCSLEYRSLPVVPTDRGRVLFGSVDPRAVTQQRWDYVRYRIRGAVDGFGIAPQGMVLNRAITTKSAEYLYDTTPEVVEIFSRSTTVVRVSDSAMFADRVFGVQVAGVLLSSTSWSFDKTTQDLTFGAPLPKAQYPVTVTFAPGKPITKEYLCRQPLEGSVTILNEGTPPVPKSRDAATTRQVRAGTWLNNPDAVLDDAESLVLNDPYRIVTFNDEASAKYASLEFCQVERGESIPIFPLSDGPGPGEGLAEIAISGRLTTDALSVPEGPAGPWGRQSPVIGGTAAQYSQRSVLLASGGGRIGGTLGPGTAILYPCARGPSGLPPAGGMGLNQQLKFSLADVTPREELVDFQSLLGDDIPPTSPDVALSPNPDGAASLSGLGQVVYQSTDYGTTSYSKTGPWGGLLVLSANSLLAGGAQLSGIEFVLVGGAQLERPTVTTGVLSAS